MIGTRRFLTALSAAAVLAAATAAAHPGTASATGTADRGTGPHGPDLVGWPGVAARAPVIHGLQQGVVGDAAPAAVLPSSSAGGVSGSGAATASRLLEHVAGTRTARGPPADTG